MNREFYSATIDQFVKSSINNILGELTKNNEFSLEQTQRDAWIEEINILQKVLLPYKGSVYFEYSIPRMGKRIDVLCIIDSTIFIFEFKIG
ncbi:MAG: hypothetical protein Q8L01_01030, partial [Candidatus Woesebacteria bacterium]|nr:hypothetical protein [Candidatus Woesebacteria bacterium]